ncbi:hypothetical protein [Nonomuraea africana]|uniref:Uncharacterized protein n=1 Tax=Nonomuraea africana TaxID=46171 RepID=A0ABR9KDN1_9ACTN|nr:hypothetical protein [Nonomuraea africana]MBE1560121.1 hypothetical protein [Nonomuraea africana]
MEPAWLTFELGCRIVAPVPPSRPQARRSWGPRTPRAAAWLIGWSRPTSGWTRPGRAAEEVRAEMRAVRGELAAD